MSFPEHRFSMICPYCSSAKTLTRGVCRTCGARIETAKSKPAPKVAPQVAPQQRKVLPIKTSPTKLSNLVLSKEVGRVLRLWTIEKATFIATDRSHLLCWEQQPLIQTRHKASIPWGCADYSHIDNSFICGDEDGALHEYFCVSEKIHTVKSHSGPITAVTIYNNLVASGGNDGAIQLWNITTGKKATVFQSLEAVTSLQFSPDGTYLAGAFDNGTLRVWKIISPPEYSQELPQTQWEWQITRHHLWIKSLAIAPGGSAFASGGYDGSVRLWGLRTGHEMQHFTLQSSVRALAFSPDNRTLASAASNTIQLWDSWTGKNLFELSAAEPVDALHFQDKVILLVAAGRELSCWKTG